MAIVDRLRGRRDVAHDVARAVTQTTDTLLERASDATATIGKAAAETRDAVIKVAGDVRDSVAGGADDLSAQVADAAGRASHDLDGLFRDARASVTSGVPAEEVVRRFERRWPGTDTDRYDRAFERGYARGRSGRLAIGMAVGAAIAGAGAYLFDTERGVARREALVLRIRRLGEDVRRTIDEQREAMANRPTDAPRAWSSAGSGVAVGPGPTTTDTLPVDAPVVPDARIPVGAGTAATAASDAERGDWHRDLPAD